MDSTSTGVETAPNMALYRLIRDRGYRQAFVAEKVGVTPATLSRYANGAQPISPRVVSNLAAFFDVPASTFLPDPELR